MQIRTLTEKEASDIDTPEYKYLKTTCEEGNKTLWYERDGLFFACYVTNDSSCWTLGGAVFDNVSDIV